MIGDDKLEGFAGSSISMASSADDASTTTCPKGSSICATLARTCSSSSASSTRPGAMAAMAASLCGGSLKGELAVGSRIAIVDPAPGRAVDRRVRRRAQQRSPERLQLVRASPRVSCSRSVRCPSRASLLFRLHRPEFQAFRRAPSCPEWPASRARFGQRALRSQPCSDAR